jgi:hypothetical protein
MLVASKTRIFLCDYYIWLSMGRIPSESAARGCVVPLSPYLLKEEMAHPDLANVVQS